MNTIARAFVLALTLTLAAPLSGCAGAVASDGYDYYLPATESDAGTPANASDAGSSDSGSPETSEPADAGEPIEPEYRLGDECWCCSWDPSDVGYPNGRVYCAQGKVTILEGLMCLAHAGDNAPSWAPKTKGCLLQNPWGAPL